MKVKSLLESKGKEVFSVNATSTVEEAIRSMHDRRISAVMVNDGESTVGIFTERDVVRCYITNDCSGFKSISVKDAMTTNLVVATLEDDLNDVMSVMVDKNIRHLPVIDSGRVIGMLSIRDIIQTMVGKLTSEIHYLKDYITGY